ncbi:hypothetical protein ACFL7M_18895 [Thermodesulfobacteriota bacterium]
MKTLSVLGCLVHVALLLGCSTSPQISASQPLTREQQARKMSAEQYKKVLGESDSSNEQMEVFNER